MTDAAVSPRLGRARAALMIAALMLGACHRETPRERGGNAARDIAKVKAAQRTIPPPAPFAPEPVSFADLDAPGIGIAIPPTVGKPRADAGCRFVAANARDRRPVFVAVRAFGLMKHDGRLLAFAADSGSPAQARGLHARYAGGAFALTLSAGEPLDADGWKSAVTVRDRYARIVYFAAGELRCRA